MDKHTNFNSSSAENKNTDNTHRSRHSSGRHRSSRKKRSSGGLFGKYFRYMVLAWLALLTAVMMIISIMLYEANSTLRLQIEQLKRLVVSGDMQVSAEDDIPSYVRDEAQRVIDEVAALQNENTFSFIAISDIHLNSEDVESVLALKHAGQALALIREQLDVGLAANLGDITWGSSTTTIEMGILEIQKANEIIGAGFDGIPNLRTVGNHDILAQSFLQNQDFLNSAELYELIGKYNEGAEFQSGEEDRGYCYRDLKDSKLRVICLNTNDIKGLDDPLSVNYCTVSPTQLQWLADTLDMSEKADSEEWTVILLSHQPLYWEGYERVVELLDAYTLGTKGVIEYQDAEINYDYIGKNSATIAANIHGHLHNFRVDSIGQARIPTIAIPNACYGRNNEYGTAYGEEIRDKYGDIDTYEKTYNTAEDTAFCIVTVDMKNQVIYVTCYGAGYNRTIRY